MLLAMHQDLVSLGQRENAGNLQTDAVAAERRFELVAVRRAQVPRNAVPGPTAKHATAIARLRRSRQPLEMLLDVVPRHVDHRPFAASSAFIAGLKRTAADVIAGIPFGESHVEFAVRPLGLDFDTDPSAAFQACAARRTMRIRSTARRIYRTAAASATKKGSH